MSLFRLYGMTHSLYTGKARSYLIKQGINYEEITAGRARFKDVVLPAIGRWIIPVMETPEGEIVQDGTDIIDWFEQRNLMRISAYPDTPQQKLLALIFELFGGEGLLRPAMHYRWNFDEHNKAFIEDQFGLFAMPDKPAAQRLEIISKSTGRMRKAAVNFGVNEQTIPTIEAAYLEFLQRLNAHFAVHPYLLGGTPTIGDYGLIAPLYAHLGRDPYPASLMKQRAPAVYRWVERMNAADPDTPEFLDYPRKLLPEDGIADTLHPLLQCIAEDYVPEVEAFVGFINDWLVENSDIGEGDLVGGPELVRGIGFCEFQWRELSMRAVVLPYRVWLLQRVQDAFDALEGADRQKVEQLLAAAGLMPLITARTTRRVQRDNNREIWGTAAQDSVV